MITNSLNIKSVLFRRELTFKFTIDILRNTWVHLVIETVKVLYSIKIKCKISMFLSLFIPLHVYLFKKDIQVLKLIHGLRWEVVVRVCFDFWWNYWPTLIKLSFHNIIQQNCNWTFLYFIRRLRDHINWFNLSTFLCFSLTTPA